MNAKNRARGNFITYRFAVYTLASCRRLLIEAHSQPPQLVSLNLLLHQICSGAPQRSVVTSSSLNKFNQPKLREESDHVTDGPGAAPALPIAVPSHPNHRRAVEEPARNRRSHDCAVNVVGPAVDGVFHEPYPDPSSSREDTKVEQDPETDLTLKKLSSIYLKLSKSRLSGKATSKIYLVSGNPTVSSQRESVGWVV